MGILLILAQIALAVLDYGAHVLTLSPWIVFLPAILFAALWGIGLFYNSTFVLDRVTPYERRPKRRR